MERQRPLNPMHEAIESILDRNDGEITCHELLDEAKREDSPIHGQFEWDDSIAGHKYRLNQAAGYIRRYKAPLRVPTVTNGIPVYRRLLSRPSQRGPDNKYETTEKILASPEKRQEMLLSILADLKILQRKWEAFHELDEIWNVIRDFRW